MSPDHFRTSGKVTRPHPDHRVGLPTTFRPSGWSPNQLHTFGRFSEHFRTSGRVSRPLPDLREGLPTSFGPQRISLDHFRISGRVCRPVPDNREYLLTSSTPPGWSPITSRPLGGSADQFHTSGRVLDLFQPSMRVSRPLPELREGLPTSSTPPGRSASTSGPPEGSPTSSGSKRVSRPVPHHREGLRLLLDLREGLPTTSRPPGGSQDHYWTSGRVSRPLPDLREGLLTTSRSKGGSNDHFQTSGRVSQPLPDPR